MSRELTIVASNLAPVGGMERVAYEIARRLQQRGWDLTVVARSCALEDVRFVRLRTPGRPVSVAMLLSTLQGSLAMARHRRGLVHAHNPTLVTRTDVLTLHFCERAYRELVGVPRNRRPSLAYRVSERVAAWHEATVEGLLIRRQARTVACVSEGLRAEVESFYPGARSRRVTIPNGVDRERFAPDPELGRATRGRLGLAPDAPTAMFIGGDWHRKGLAVAIEAVAAAPGWRLLVVGAGDEEHFAAHARAHGAADRVRFAGLQRDPRPYYAAADALLLTSSYEAFSLVSLEAAAMGLALLQSPVNGTAELVRDGVNGHVVEPDPAAIAARLRALDAGALARMGAAARESSAAYDWERITDAYEALYAELSAAR